MKKINAGELVTKYAEGRCTMDEQLLVEAGFAADLKNGYEEISNEEIEAAYLHIKDRIEKDLSPNNKKSGYTRLWPRIGIAAAVLIVATGIWLYVDKLGSMRKNPYGNIIANDIAPGKQGAILTLADGRKIRLSEETGNEIIEEAGVGVTKTKDGQLIYELKNNNGNPNKINTLATGKGQTYQLILSDKSKVWLNASSSLTYAVNLKAPGQGGTRLVKLEGEAYFEVAKDKIHPFVVRTMSQEVEVLGTHFNISSYRDEKDVRTTLLEGKVKVSFGIDSVSKRQGGSWAASKELQPSEQSILNREGIKVRKINNEDAIAWKNGLFVFEDESLESIMRKIARWYDVEVVYTEGVNKNELYYGSVSRYDKVSKVVEALELTKSSHFKIEGRRITVMK